MPRKKKERTTTPTKAREKKSEGELNDEQLRDVAGGLTSLTGFRAPQPLNPFQPAEQEASLVEAGNELAEGLADSSGD